VKRFVAIFSILGIGFFLSPYLYFVNAANDICPVGFENLCIKVEDNPNIIGNIIQILIVIAVIVSLIYLIMGGIRWIMSG